jgi:hypothetical protein
MHFMRTNGWYCQFLEEDLKTPLPLKLALDDPEKSRELAKRGGVSMILENRQAIDHGTRVGRGSVWLSLTLEQYEKLKRPSRGGRTSGRIRSGS